MATILAIFRDLEGNYQCFSLWMMYSDVYPCLLCLQRSKIKMELKTLSRLLKSKVLFIVLVAQLAT